MSAAIRWRRGVARSLFVLGAGLLADQASVSAVHAQSRTFDVCVLGRFQTCSTFELSTFASASVSGGTDVVVNVRQNTMSGRATGLMAFSFLFPVQLGFDPVPPIPGMAAVIGGGITPVAGPIDWRYQGTADRMDVFHEPVSPGSPATSTQFLAGCAGGAFSGGFFQTALSTCGPVTSYGFFFSTKAFFSANDVSGFGLELYAGADDDAENGRTASCSFWSVAPSTADDGACIDFADLNDPFVPFAAPTITPEPGAFALMGAGLLAIAAVARRRRV